ncbi:MAG TPA: thermonuclease family protein [Gemmatimonadaceae bacterium]|nr:thermonuclease family protein [Gemmatimonadaceae bacterium]
MRKRVHLLLVMGLLGSVAGCRVSESLALQRAALGTVATDSVFLRASDEALARMTKCTVTDVVDGDTFRCGNAGRVRLLLIDTPERDQEPWGERARGALMAILPTGSTAWLETDVQVRDRYGRMLAYVYRTDGLQVNELMVRNGFAEVLVYPPNVRHVDVLRSAREAAREAGRGLWSTEAFACSPRDHRAGRCQ